MDLIIKKMFSIIICVVCLITGCYQIDVNANIISSCKSINYYGFVIEKEQALFYYNINEKGVDLYFYNHQTGDKKVIDNIIDANMYVDVYPMFLIDDRIYYAKCPNNRSIADIYSIDTNTLIPKYEGTVKSSNDNSVFYDSYIGEIHAANDFEIFKYNDNIYVFVAGNVYNIDGENKNIVAEHISSMYIYGTKIYYSKVDDGIGSGVFCYDIKTKKSKEIITAEAIEKLNSEQIIRHIYYYVLVSNIIVDDENIYFIGTKAPALVYQYNLHDSSLEVLNNSIDVTEKFKKYGDKIFYIPTRKGGLYGYDLKDKESFLATNSHMLSYNFYGDYLYFYKILDYGECIVELQRYNIKTKEISII